MSRYILRFTGVGPAPAADVARIQAERRVQVLEASSRMLLVEASAEDAAEVVGSLSEWICSAERTLQLPDPRPKPRRLPGRRDES